MVPVWTPREGLAIGERLRDGLRIGRVAPENLPLLRRRVCEVLELHELRGLRNAGLRDREEVAAALRRVVLRLERVEHRQCVHAARGERRAEEVLVHLVERLGGNARLHVVLPVGVEERLPRSVLERKRLRRPYKRTACLVHVRELRKLVVVVDEHVPDRQVRDVERHLVLERHEPQVV